MGNSVSYDPHHKCCTRHLPAAAFLRSACQCNILPSCLLSLTAHYVTVDGNPMQQERRWVASGLLPTNLFSSWLSLLQLSHPVDSPCQPQAARGVKRPSPPSPPSLPLLHHALLTSSSSWPSSSSCQRPRKPRCWPQLRPPRHRPPPPQRQRRPGRQR